MRGMNYGPGDYATWGAHARECDPQMAHEFEPLEECIDCGQEFEMEDLKKGVCADCLKFGYVEKKS